MENQGETKEKPRETKENQGKTKEKPRKNQGKTKENQGKPRETKENQGKPRKQRKPLQSTKEIPSNQWEYLQSIGFLSKQG